MCLYKLVSNRLSSVNLKVIATPVSKETRFSMCQTCDSWSAALQGKERTRERGAHYLKQLGVQLTARVASYEKIIQLPPSYNTQEIELRDPDDKRSFTIVVKKVWSRPICKIEGTVKKYVFNMSTSHLFKGDYTYLDEYALGVLYSKLNEFLKIDDN